MAWIEDSGGALNVVAATAAGGALVIAGWFGSTFFRDAHEVVAEREGGYSNHEADRGGETMYGVTEETARETGYTGDMKDLTRMTADSIAYANYWLPLQLDYVSEQADTAYVDVAAQLYDISYNAGPARAGEYFQRCLNVLNAEERWYFDVTVDGSVGRETLWAFDGYVERRGAQGAPILHTCIKGLQTYLYIYLSERDPNQEAFTYGWLRRVTDESLIGTTDIVLWP